jgi:hypothetical protein
MRKPKEKYALDPEAEASIEQIAEGLRRYLRILLVKEDPPRKPRKEKQG